MCRIFAKSRAKFSLLLTQVQRQGSLKARVPDGGWGWAVVFGSFMIHLINGAVTTSYFGVSLSDIGAEFMESRSASSWIGSIHLGVAYGAGPLTGMFVNRFGCRIGVITGSIIATSGFGLSYFAPSVMYLYLSMGLIGGFGIAMMYLPAVVVVSMYFERKRSLATGIAVCGVGFGTFIMAPLFAYFVTNYGWRWSVFSVCALTSSGAIIGLLFRPVDSSSQKEAVTDSDSEKHSLLRAGQRDTDTKSKYSSRNVLQTVASETVASYGSNVDTKTGEKLDSPVFVQSTESETYSPVFLSTLTASPSFSQKNEASCIKLWKGLTLLASPVFLLVAVCNFLFFLAYFIPYIYIADLARTQLLLVDDELHAGWLVSSIGITNTLSRVIMGYFSDKKWANRIYIYSCVLTLTGFAIAAHPVGNSLAWLYVCGALFGACSGSFISLTPVILVDLFGLDKLNDSFGIVLLFQGAGVLLGPPIVGAFFDAYKSYIYGFLFAGISAGMSGIFVFFVPFIQRLQLA